MVTEVSNKLFEKHSNNVTELYNQNLKQKEIAKRLGLSESTVGRIVERLKDQGKITKRVTAIEAARKLFRSLPEGSVIDRVQISKQTGLDNTIIGKLLQTEFKNKNFITREKANRLKAFNALKKLIAEDKNISISALEKEIKVPATVIGRVFDENFKGQGVMGRSRGRQQSY